MNRAPVRRAPKLDCEIIAPSDRVAADLARIVRDCARDLGQPLEIHPSADEAVDVPMLTLHLPAVWAAAQHPIWCLACRLACFCPEARVSVLVQTAASSPPQPGRKAPRARTTIAA